MLKERMISFFTDEQANDCNECSLMVRSERLIRQRLSCLALIKSVAKQKIF